MTPLYALVYCSAMTDTTTIKLNRELVERLREIAKRDGLLLGRLIERLIEAGIRAEKLK